MVISITHTFANMAAHTKINSEIQNVNQYVTCYSLNAFSFNGWNEIGWNESIDVNIGQLNVVEY